MTTRTHLITLAVLLIAFAARLNTLGDPPFWYDEGLVGWSARLPFLETARWTAADVHPPLYFWAVTVWRWFGGETEFALRFLSIAFGFLSVVAVYKIGERIQGPAVGNLAALFIGLSRFHIWWSQELRMYILGSLFMLLSVWLTLRIWHPHSTTSALSVSKGVPFSSDRILRHAQDASCWNWLAYILVSTAGLYSIYLVAFTLAFESLYVTGLLAWRVLARRRSSTSPPAPLPSTRSGQALQGEGRLFLQWVGAQAIVALLFVPWFLYFLSQFRTWSDSTPFDFALFVQFYSTLLAVGAPSSIDQWLAPVIVIWAVLIVGALVGVVGAVTTPLRARDGAARHGGWLIVLLLVLPPLSVYLGTSPRSFFYTPRVEARYLFPFIWSFYLVLAWCVWRIARAQRWLGLAAALAVIVLSSASLTQYYASRQPNDVYQSLTATLRAYQQPSDGVLLHDDRTWPIFEFYYAHGNKDWKGVPNGSKMRASDAEQFLSAFWEAHDAVWMVWNEDALRIDESHALEQWLAAHAVFTREEVFGTKRLIFYARTEARAQTAGLLASTARPMYATNTPIADGVSLIGYDQPLRRFRVGDEIVLGLYWQSQPSREIVIALRDARGVERGRQSLTLPSGAARTLVRYPVTT
ncbi:MAG: glycosyltransferase family 39 protein, partial [Chloroflexota bacterium]